MKMNLSKKILIILFAAIITLGGCGKGEREKVVDAKIKALQSQDVSIRIEAVRTLDTLKDPKAIEPLISLLDDEDLTVRESVTSALISMGEPAVVPLIAALNNDSWVISSNAERILEKIAPGWLEREAAKKSIPYLIQKLKDEDLVVREKAIESLEVVGEPAMPQLIDALIDESRLISENSGRALMRIDLFWSHGELAKQAIPEIIATLKKDGNPKVQANATAVLMKLGAPAVAPLITALRSDDWLVQKNAAWILGNINKEWIDSEAAKLAVPGFIAALNDEKEASRLGAAIALGMIKDPSAVKPLIATLDDEFLYARAYAEKALKKITGQDFGNDKKKWLEYWDNNVSSDNE